MKKNYGLPYQGSKNKIAEEIVNFLPQKKVLVDLFGGGGAISVCASQSGKYEKIIYNELNSIISETFKKAINGEFENDRRWISHEDFDKLKNTDGYVAICFSFSNNCNTYMYGPKIEPYKRAYHYAIVFDDFEPFNELFDDETTEKIKKSVEGITDLKKRRLKFTKALGEYILSLDDPELNKTIMPAKTYIGHVNQNLEYKERLDLLKHTTNLAGGNARNLIQNLECQERLDVFLSIKQQIEIQNKDYREVNLPEPEECVIYCDIPYEKTSSYTTGSFDYERFYKWCKEKTSEGYQIYVSSYELPDDLFVLVWEKQRLSGAFATNKHVVEKIFITKCDK